MAVGAPAVPAAEPLGAERGSRESSPDNSNRLVKSVFRKFTGRGNSSTPAANGDSRDLSGLYCCRYHSP